MMPRRIMIGCGVAFLAALLLICTFSLGIYAGERGLGRARPAPPAGVSPQGGIVQPGGPPNVIGTLQRFGDNTITLVTLQGPRTIALTPQTAIRRENDAALVSDLRPGTAVAVWGDPGPSGRMMVARVIAILVPEK